MDLIKRCLSKFNTVKGDKGFTLVELVVCMALTAILATAVVSVMFPATNIFIRMQKLSRAQMVADNIADALRKECADSYVTGYSDIRLINLQQSLNYTKGDDGLLTTLATETGASRNDGNCLIIRKNEKISEAIYWNIYVSADDYIDVTGSDSVPGSNTVTSMAVYRLFPKGASISKASDMPFETRQGYLHFGYYESKKGNVTIAGVDTEVVIPEKAYDYTNPFSVNAYNGFTVAVTYSDFTYESVVPGSTSLYDLRPSYVIAHIKVYDGNYDKQSADTLIYTRDAVLCFAKDNVK